MGQFCIVESQECQSRVQNSPPLGYPIVLLNISLDPLGSTYCIHPSFLFLGLLSLLVREVWLVWEGGDERQAIGVAVCSAGCACSQTSSHSGTWDSSISCLRSGLMLPRRAASSSGVRKFLFPFNRFSSEASTISSPLRNNSRAMPHCSSHIASQRTPVGVLDSSVQASSAWGSQNTAASQQDRWRASGSLRLLPKTQENTVLLPLDIRVSHQCPVGDLPPFPPGSTCWSGSLDLTPWASMGIK